MMTKAQTGYKPATPEAEQLKKFIDMPVDYATGIPDISFPLFSLKSGQISYPLAIRYHSGGSKYNEKSTWVGMGWDFTGELDISRSSRGGKPGSGDSYNTNTNLGLIGSFSLNERQGYLRALANGDYNEQPDEYQFRTLNNSGKFYFKKQADGSMKALVVPYVDVDIVQIAGGFEITEPDGTKYRYGKGFDGTSQVELTTVNNNNPDITAWKCTAIISPSKKDTLFFDYYPPVNTYSESSNDRAEVFDSATGSVYSTNPARYNLYSSDNLYSSGGLYPSGMFQYYFIPGPPASYDVQYMGITPINFITTTTGTLKLKRAWCRNGAIDYYFNSSLYKLDSLVYRNYNNTAIKRVVFSYSQASPLLKLDYFLLYGADPNSGDKYSFEYAPGTIPNYYVKTSNPYGFAGGEDISFAPFVSDRRSCLTITPFITGTLQYDYLNSEFNDGTTANLSFRFGFQFKNGPMNYDPSNPSNDGYYQRTVTLEQSNVNALGVLTRVNYPTGGHTDYEYSPHYVDDIATATWDGSVTHTKTPVGGLRVTSIKKYDGVNSQPVLAQYYRYGTGESDMGYLKVPLNENYYNYEQQLLYLDDADHIAGTERLRTYLEKPTIQSVLNSMGCHVYYPEVAVYSSVDGHATGKTIYTYDTPTDGSPYYSAVPGTPLVADYVDFWDKGKLKAVTNYQFYNNNFEWISSKEYEYVTKTYAPDIYVGKAWCSKKVANRDPSYSSSTISGGDVFATYEEYQYINYGIRVANSLISHETDKTRDISTNSTITNEQFYYYDNPAHFFPTRQVSYTSTGKTKSAYMVYPSDYLSGTPFIDLLTSNHIIGNPIEKVVVQQDQYGTKVLSGQATTYKSSVPGLTDKTYTLETAAPIDVTAFKFSNMSVGSLPDPTSSGLFSLDSHYKETFSLDYDNNGNPNLVTSRNVATKAYQWGYRGTLPVAEALNAKSADIFYDSFEEGSGNSNLNDCKTGHYSFTGSYSKSLNGLDNGTYTLSYWSKGSGTWTWITNTVAVSSGSYTISLGGQVDDVRFYPSNALMTTYTYDPLVGMTSMTDPKGQITYYEYDNSKRLMNIKDNNHNITKHLDYHYQGQN